MLNLSYTMYQENDPCCNTLQILLRRIDIAFIRGMFHLKLPHVYNLYAVLSCMYKNECIWYIVAEINVIKLFNVIKATYKTYCLFTIKKIIFLVKCFSKTIVYFL